MMDVVTVGSATIDHFLTTSRKFAQIKLGDKVLVDELETHTGGGATNTAAALGKMGLKVKALMKVGKDGHGHLIRHELSREYGVQVIQTKRSAKPTDFSAIVHAKQDKDRIIYAYKGASDDLRWTDFPKTELNAKWIYLATLMHDAWKTALKIAAYAKKNNINLLFNPSKYLASQGKKVLAPILKATTLLVLNKGEAQSILHTKESNTSKLAERLAELGPKMVVITCGPKSACLHTGEKTKLHKPFSIKVVHTAGAGDAFTSGLLAGLIKGKKPDEAMKIGMANAASVIQSVGTKNGLLSWNQALRYISQFK